MDTNEFEITDTEVHRSNDLYYQLQSFNQPLFCDSITELMRIDSSAEPSCKPLVELVDPVTLLFIEPALLLCIQQILPPDSSNLDERVVNCIPLCKRIAMQCHNAIENKNIRSNPLALNTTPFIKSIWRSTDLSQLLSVNATERAFALVTVISRLEWVISCLVNRRLHLKDNLLSQCVVDILGSGLVVVLQCLLGCVKGFNLKNLCWHGFLSPSNVPKEICSLIYCTVCTVNSKLTQRNVKKRTSNQIKLIPNLSQPSELSESLCHLIIKHSSLIHSEQRQLWFSLLELSTTLLYSQTTPSYNMKLSSLNVVLLQHCLRRLWVVASESDVSRCSAQKTEFYITLDEMFSPEIPSDIPRPGASYFSSVYTKHELKREKNVLLENLGSGTFFALLDLLIHGEGLRLRDKLSHCECEGLSTETSRHVLNLSLSILARFCESGVQRSCSKLLSHYKHYQHRYHPHSLILNSLADIDRIAADLTSFVEEVRSLDLESKEVDSVEKFESLLISISDLSICEPSIKLFVGQSKTKYYSLILQILREMISYSTELLVVCRNKRDLFSLRKLRSRQRQNFFSLLGSLPIFIRCLTCSRVLVYRAILHVESLASLDFEENKEFLKLLKSSLKCFENMVTIVGQCKWTEIGKFLIGYLKSWNTAIFNGVLLP